MEKLFPNADRLFPHLTWKEVETGPIYVKQSLLASCLRPCDLTLPIVQTRQTDIG